MAGKKASSTIDNKYKQIESNKVKEYETKTTSPDLSILIP